MKKAEWVNGNHQRIDTGHKTFDRQIGGIGTGNVIDNVQFSSYVRPAREVTCNGQHFEPGHLQNFDLRPFHEKGMPSYVDERVRKLANAHGGVILYAFRSWANGREVIHGYVVTKRHESYEFLKSWVTGPTHKSWGVIETCKDYVSNPAKG